MSLHPFYLPREFPQIFVTVVYIHPKVNDNTASEAMAESVQRRQGIAPDAPIFIMGDFSMGSLWVGFTSTSLVQLCTPGVWTFVSTRIRELINPSEEPLLARRTTMLFGSIIQTSLEEEQARTKISSSLDGGVHSVSSGLFFLY